MPQRDESLTAFATLRPFHFGRLSLWNGRDGMTKFVSIDGIDGGGKSTQLQRIEGWFQDHSLPYITVRDPGSTALGESIREILLHREEVAIEAEAEMLLYMAARAQLVREKIRPALLDGKNVIADRFLLANVVYQGYGGGLDVETIWQVGSVATAGIRPDLTVVLDLPVETALARVGTGQDRLEKRGPIYFEKVRTGFLEQMKRASDRSVRIDATRSPDEVHSEIARHLRDLFLI